VSLRARIALTALTWAAVTAVIVCQVVFPAFRHALAGFSWVAALGTGWVLRTLWEKRS
jgi:hypothetical protein